jgi:hypothetical protein
VLQALDIGHDDARFKLASAMYLDHPYAREVGHVGEAAGAATPEEIGHVAPVAEGAAPAEDAEVHYAIPVDVLSDVCHWLRMGPLDVVTVLGRAWSIVLASS